MLSKAKPKTLKMGYPAEVKNTNSDPGLLTPINFGVFFVK
jgi:hypothetical protein